MSQSVKDIPGIGEGTATVLMKNRIRTAKALAEAHAGRIAAKLGVSESRASALIRSARAHVEQVLAAVKGAAKGRAAKPAKKKIVKKKAVGKKAAKKKVTKKAPARKKAAKKKVTRKAPARKKAAKKKATRKKAAARRR